MKRVLVIVMLLFLIFDTAPGLLAEELPDSYGAESNEGLYPVLKLDRLIEIALKENHDLLMAGSGIDISRYRIPQAGTLPEPMIMVGYENEGWSRYTYGEMPGARWIFSASQMIPWPGKLRAKELSARKEAESSKFSYERIRLGVIEEVKTRYYELLLAHKNLETTRQKLELLEMIEEIAGSRYKSGMASLSELIMAQTEKYMATEQEIMLRQRIKALGAMINSLIGREPSSPIGIPEERFTGEKELQETALLEKAMDSPELKELRELISAREYKYQSARLEYYPDLTVSAQVSLKPEPYEDMWMLSLSFNLPVFYRTRQKNMILEARSEVDEARHRLEASEQMLRANIIDAISMLRASEELIGLYRDAFIPKAEEGLEAGLAAYRTGKIALPEVIKSLNFLIDQRLNYWRQIVEREKAIARLERLCGGMI